MFITQSWEKRFPRSAVRGTPRPPPPAAGRGEERLLTGASEKRITSTVWGGGGAAGGGSLKGTLKLPPTNAGDQTRACEAAPRSPGRVGARDCQGP